MLWDDTYAQRLIELGVVRGASSPCCFWHPKRHMRVVVHGNDFTILSTHDALRWFDDELSKSVEIKVSARIREAAHLDKEVTILNRVLKLDGEGLHYEADPRHAELLIKSIGFDNANTAVTPGVKPDDVDLDAVIYQPFHPDPQQHEEDTNAHDVKLHVSSLIPINKRNNKTRGRVQFADKDEILNDVAYSNLYSLHPRLLVAPQARYVEKGQRRHRTIHRK